MPDKKKSDKKLRIAICEDHHLYLQGLQQLIGSDPYLKKNAVLIFTSHDGRELLSNPLLKDVNFIILDINLPGVNGFEIAETIKKEYPYIKVLILSITQDNNYLKEMMRYGIDGYIIKSDAPELIVKAIQDIESGYLGISPSFSPLTSQSKSDNELSRRFDFLSKRETEVLGYLAREMPAKDIAEQLGCKVETIYSHTKSIIRKLRTKNVEDWQKLARDKHLI